ncbi:hypothetical protein CEXT_706691, partial [Caerostris extrusa]
MTREGKDCSNATCANRTRQRSETGVFCLHLAAHLGPFKTNRRTIELEEIYGGRTRCWFMQMLFDKCISARDNELRSLGRLFVKMAATTTGSTRMD